MRKFFIIIGLLATVYFSVIYLVPMIANEKASKFCPGSSEYILVKMGEHIFELPRKEAFLYLGRNGESLKEYYKGGCQKAGDPAYEVTEFSYSLRYYDKKHGWLAGKYRDEKIATQQGKGFTLSIGANLGYGNTDTYKMSVEPLLRKGNIALSDHLVEGEFYVLQDPKNKWQKYYVSRDKNFVTPSDNPVTFVCHFYGDRNECSSVVEWKNDIAFTFSHLNDLHVKPPQWKNFYYDFLKYVESVEVTESYHKPKG